MARIPSKLSAPIQVDRQGGRDATGAMLTASDAGGLIFFSFSFFLLDFIHFFLLLVPLDCGQAEFSNHVKQVT